MAELIVRKNSFKKPFFRKIPLTFLVFFVFTPVALVIYLIIEILGIILRFLNKIEK
tara:strand:+ start:904 stop:1071 length:168 start_codon:yes stop_codon:yes gene_type:complete